MGMTSRRETDYTPLLGAASARGLSDSEDACLEALHHARLAAQHELEGANLLRLVRQGNSQRHAFAVGGPRVDRGMLIGGLSVTDRATVLAHEDARHVEGSISGYWNWCLHRAMRAVELHCAVSRIEDQFDVLAAPRALWHESAGTARAATARQDERHETQTGQVRQVRQVRRGRRGRRG